MPPLRKPVIDGHGPLVEGIHGPRDAVRTHEGRGGALVPVTELVDDGRTHRPIPTAGHAPAPPTLRALLLPRKIRVRRVQAVDAGVALPAHARKDVVIVLQVVVRLDG